MMQVAHAQVFALLVGFVVVAGLLVLDRVMHSRDSEHQRDNDARESD